MSLQHKRSATLVLAVLGGGLLLLSPIFAAGGAVGLILVFAAVFWATGLRCPRCRAPALSRSTNGDATNPICANCQCDFRDV
jgi:hypothetical protein